MRVAAGGFKSITRIASADPTMWSSILLNNGELISEQLEDYIDALKEIDEKIKKQDQKALFDFFKAAKIGRDSLGPEKLVRPVHQSCRQSRIPGRRDADFGRSAHQSGQRSYFGNQRRNRRNCTIDLFIRKRSSKGFGIVEDKV